MVNPELLRATAFHEAAHVATALALQHRVESVRFDFQANAPKLGATRWTTESRKGLPFLLEECAVEHAIGGLAERKHDPDWKPEATFRDDDLLEMRNALKKAAARDDALAPFLARCDEIADALLSDADLWTGITAVAAWLQETFPDRYEEWEFLGSAVERELKAAVPTSSLDRLASEIRKHGLSLNAIWNLERVDAPKDSCP